MPRGGQKPSMNQSVTRDVMLYLPGNVQCIAEDSCSGCEYLASYSQW